MSGLMAALWPAIEDSMDELMKSYPPALKDAFNITELNSVEAYVDGEMLSFIVPLAIAFLAVRCATRAISTAEERGFLDAVLAAPLARRTLVAGSFIVCALVVAVVLAVITALTWLTGTIAGAEPSLARARRAGSRTSGRWRCCSAGWPLLAAGVLHRAASVTAVSVGVLATMYIVDLMGKLADPIEPLRFARRSSTTARRSTTASTRSPSPASPSRAPCWRRSARSSSTGATCARRHRHDPHLVRDLAHRQQPGGNEPLALDPVNAWAATLILAAALDFARPDSFKPAAATELARERLVLRRPDPRHEEVRERDHRRVRLLPQRPEMVRLSARVPVVGERRPDRRGSGRRTARSRSASSSLKRSG